MQSVGTDLRERAPLNPTYIYSMAHLHTNRCYHYNPLCFWSPPPPPPPPAAPPHTPCPWQCNFRQWWGGAELDAATAQSGGAPGVWFCFILTVCKWHWNLPEGDTVVFKNEHISGICPSLWLPHICYVCIGCHQGAWLIFRAHFCFCVWGFFEQTQRLNDSPHILVTDSNISMRHVDESIP